MGERSGISWTQASHGFWYGCRKVSQGCRGCYAEREMEKYGMNFNVVTRAKGFSKPLSWKEPKMIFVDPWSDFFIEDADSWRDEAWGIIARTPHVYQILTKRPELIQGRLPKTGWPYPNVWLGVSVENRETLWRMDVLRGIPAEIRWISFEPLLEDLGEVDLEGFGWAVVGCESGPKARPMDPAWARSLRDRCVSAKIPFFLKQMMSNDKLVHEPELDGRRWTEFPPTAMVQKSLF